MCGISGYYQRHHKVPLANIKRMNDAIAHRGPDDEGFVSICDGDVRSYAGNDSYHSIKYQLPIIPIDIVSNLALGFRRLSILDLSERGHQPMIRSSVVITFNGEIYNFLEVRMELEELGIVFDSATDTEVFIQAYLKWGITCIQKFNGMFSCCILDVPKNRIFLIRDRLGIKPLFYYKDENSIAWCSEIKGLLKADWIHPELDIDGLISNYLFIATPPPNTCFQNIRSVEPGNYLQIDISTFSIQNIKYWNIPIGNPSFNTSIEESTYLILNQLKDSVSKYMVSDIPLISMMSGGIDSTLITALGLEKDKNLASYTLAIDGSGTGLDELPQARHMADYLGIKQLVHFLHDDEIVHSLNEHVEHFEEPYNNIDVVFHAAKYLNKEKYNVVLSGNGADEVFGGYQYNLMLGRFKKIQKLSLLAYIIPSINYKLKNIKNHLKANDIAHFFLNNRWGFKNFQINELLNGISKDRIQDVSNIYVNKDRFKNAYEGLFYHDLKYSIGAYHAYHDDLCSMKYSVEMRFPYLDHNLIELVSQIPMAHRFNGIESKPLLRKVAQSYIPTENLNMPKKGFTLPLTRIIMENKEVKKYIDIQLDFLKRNELFNAKAIDSVYLNDCKRKNFSNTWQLVSTSVWMKKYFDVY